MAITKEINIIANTEEAQKNVDNLNQSVKRVDDSSEKLEKQNKETAKSAKGVGTAVKGIGVALKAIGIGLIIALFAKLVDVFSKNQKVADFFSNTMTSLSIIFNDLFSFITDNLHVITDIFENPLESLKSLGNAIKNNIIERFKSALEVAGFLGKGLKQLFEGDFSGALDTAKLAGEELIDVFTGVDDSLNKAGGLIDGAKEYASAVWDQAAATTELVNQSRLAEAQQRRIFEQYDRDAEIQRRLRDNFELTAQQRLDANEELRRILDEQEKIQLRLGRISVAAAQADIAATGDNIDNKVALIEALGELDAIEADIAGRRAEQEAQDRALRKEILDARKEEIGEVLDIEELRVEKEVENIERVVQARLDAAQKEKEIAEAQLQFRKDTFNAEADVAIQFGQVLQQLGEENKALAIAGIIAEQIGSTAKIILSTTEANAKAVAASPLTAGQPFVAINTISAGLGIASGVAAAAKAISALGGGGGAGGGQGANSIGNGQSAPSFNVVGTSGQSQIAQSLGQQNEPIEAFVVAGNVSSAQSANRNIVETATIG